MSLTMARGLSPIRTVLDNGVVVLVQETSSAPAVTIHATVPAGGVHEPPDLTGLAYLAGRMLDRGTGRRPGDLIGEQLDERGVALKVSTNRHTLAVSCNCLSEDFDELLSIVLDVLRRPIFAEREIAKRRAELVTALRQDEDNPGVRAVETLFELLYGAAHPYGRRVKGSPDSLERIGRPDLVAFHAARFRPASLRLAIVGDVRQAHALERVAFELEDWVCPPPEDVPVPPAVGGGGRRLKAVTIAGKSQSDIAYGFASIRRLDPRFYAYWMMNNILGQFGLGGRLADNIRERHGMAYYAFSAFEPNVIEGPLLIRAGVDPNNVDRALDAIDFEVARLAAEGPTPGELEATRDCLIGSTPRTLETNQSIAAFLQTAEQFGLGLDYDRRIAQHLLEVTLEQVHAAAAEVLQPDQASVAIAGPPATGEYEA